MKRFLMAVVVTCLLSVSAIAGDIPTGDAPQPPPPPGSIRTTGAKPQDQTIQAGIPESESASLDILESVMVTILSLLAR